MSVPPECPLVKSSDYSSVFGKVLVIGGDRGLGLAIVTLLSSNGCTVFSTSRKNGSNAVRALANVTVIEDIDLLDDSAPTKIVAQLPLAVDTVFHSAGYFTTEGPLTDLNREEQLKMINICAVAPVFVIAALLEAKRFNAGARVGFITSEGGSIGLRTEKEGGANYGHHMSKCAANMAGRLMAWDLKPHGVALVSIHPGFLRTEMTANKYAHLYDEMNAVTAEVAAPYILQCVADLSLESTGEFVAAMGSFGLGLGEYALPMELKFGHEIASGGRLPF